MKYVKKEEKEVKTEKFDLKEAFTLWLNVSKEGNKYLSGYDFEHNRLIGFFNKVTNEKQPAFRIYGVDDEGSISEVVITLWSNTSKKGNAYLSGTTNENEAIIAYYNESEDMKKPHIRGYFKKDN